MPKKERDEAPNLFPGNWDVDTEMLLKTYELWFPQNWSPVDLPWDEVDRADRKSTRLNSSHGYISYAVFCLKKKIRIEFGSRAAVRADRDKTPLNTTQGSTLQACLHSAR